MSGNGENILLVDDEHIALDAMRRILEARGFRVRTGYNYDDARKSFEQHGAEIDLLVTDLSLPGISGVEVAMELLKPKARP